MKCESVIVQYSGDKPISYSLVIQGVKTSFKPPIGSTYKKMSFSEAYATFPAIQKRWNPDGTAKY